LHIDDQEEACELTKPPYQLLNYNAGICHLIRCGSTTYEQHTLVISSDGIEAVNPPRVLLPHGLSCGIIMPERMFLGAEHGHRMRTVYVHNLFRCEIEEAVKVRSH
jgi:hypothetical protein